jgi:DNA-binding ferritin-like protein
MDRIEHIACFYIAFLRAIALIHQSSHWLSRGSNFYGDHLMHERNYKSVLEDGDAAAEKLVALFSDEVLEPQIQAMLISKLYKEFSSHNPVENSLNAEKAFLEKSKMVYDKIKNEGKMTQGLDDLILGIANNREGAVYLLSRVQKEAMHNSNKIARKLFLRRIAR